MLPEDVEVVLALSGGRVSDVPISQQWQASHILALVHRETGHAQAEVPLEHQPAKKSISIVRVLWSQAPRVCVTINQGSPSHVLAD